MTNDQCDFWETKHSFQLGTHALSFWTFKCEAEPMLWFTSERCPFSPPVGIWTQYLVRCPWKCPSIRACSTVLVLSRVEGQLESLLDNFRQKAAWTIVALLPYFLPTGTHICICKFGWARLCSLMSLCLIKEFVLPPLILTLHAICHVWPHQLQRDT